MTLEEILNEKVSKKQIVAIVGMVTVAAEPYLVAAICAAAIICQAILDWRKGTK